MKTSTKILGIVVLLLFILTLAIWVAAWHADRRALLTVSFLDVGQGDAVFIEAPSGRQVLIDGGSGSAVLRRLGEVMPFWDRSLDLVIATHPDADHIGGLIGVLQRYEIGYVIESSVQGSTPTSKAFEEAILSDEKKGTNKIIATRGQIIDLGRGAYLEVLSPDRPLMKAETNTACVVTRLVYGDTAFMLPCDAPSAIEKYLAALDGTSLHADVLKAAHHGSKTSSAPIFVGFVDPQYVVYSRGCNNSYGHPHQDTIETFARFQIPTLDTCREGTITFISDGATIRRK